MSSGFYDFLSGELKQIEADGLYKRERIITSEQFSEIDVNQDGQDSHVINFCANNYLGLANRPELIEAAPRVRRIQVVHIEDEGALDLLARYEPFVDAFLLDSGKTFGADQQFGGTGTTHNWAISRRFVEKTDIPVYLAGGLNSANVFEAITQVRPYGVDLCTGVRTDDQLDPAKLEAFMSEVLRAGQALAD